MLRIIGKQSVEFVESIRKKKRKAGIKEWGVMDDESGESIEPMEEVPLKELSESIGEISANNRLPLMATVNRNT